MAPKGPKSILYKYSQLATIKDNEVEYSGAKILPWGHVACGVGGGSSPVVKSRWGGGSSPVVKSKGGGRVVRRCCVSYITGASK